MSKLGFGDVAAKAIRIKRDFLRGGILLAKQEIAENFNNQSNKETSMAWNDVVRDVPPPILNVTGALKDDTTIQINESSAILTKDPIDKRGRGYASYHEDGENQYRSKSEFQREFVTHSLQLENEQIALLTELIDKAFL